MSEITKTKKQSLKTRDRLIWLFFALSAVLVYFFALDSIPLLGPDEPRYAEVAREMFEKNDWITPTLGGFDWFEKPALLYWLEVVSYKIFGVSEFAARFGSALCGLGTIFSLWILGRFLAAENTEKNEEKYLLSVVRRLPLSHWLWLVSASSIGLLTFSRAASFDIILTFPITAALTAFFIFDQSRQKTFAAYHLPLAAFYLFIGVALLAKGLVGVVFPLAIVAVYFVFSRKLPNSTFVSSLFWGTILSLSIAAIWYLPMYEANGWKFIDEFFIQHHFARYASNKFQHPQPFWFFWLVLPLMTIPWLPFFLASIWNLFSRRGVERQSEEMKPQIITDERGLKKIQERNSLTLDTRLPSLRTFAVAWLLVPLVFFSFSGSKLPGYILPALPAALILTAEYISRFVQKSKRRETFVHLTALATFALVVVILQFFVVAYTRAETVKSLIETANANGCAGAKVFSLNTISHSAEFYAAGKLLRTPDGKQRRFFETTEIVAEMKREGVSAALVLVPVQFLNQLTESDLVAAKVLDDNSELAIVAVKIE